MESTSISSGQRTFQQDQTTRAALLRFAALFKMQVSFVPSGVTAMQAKSRKKMLFLNCRLAVILLKPLPLRPNRPLRAVPRTDMSVKWKIIQLK